MLECWFPVQKYYRGYNTTDWYLDGLAALGSSKVNKILQLELFHNLFPFVGALAFAYVIWMIADTHTIIKLFKKRIVKLFLE